MTTKNGKTVARIIALAISVVMLVAFATGCSDKAMARADEAYAYAGEAKDAASAADQAAKDAQNAADAAKEEAEKAGQLAAGKVTEEEVTAAIEKVLKDQQEAGGIVTKEVLAAELEKLLTGDQLAEQIKAVEEKITAAIAEHAEESDAALAEKLNSYLTSDKISALVDEAAAAAEAGAVEEAKTLIAAAVETINSDIEDLGGDLADLKTTIEEEMETKLADLKTEIEDIINNILPGYVAKDEYKALNEKIFAAYLIVCDKQDAFAEENEGRYSNDAFDSADDVFEITKLALVRAIDEADLEALGVVTDEDGNIIDVEVPGITNVPTILDDLYKALGEVPETILLFIEGREDNNDSKEKIDACIELLAQATGFTAEEIANYEYIDENGETATVDLGEAVEELETYYYDVLEGAYDYANNGDYVEVGAGAAFTEGLVYYEIVDGEYVVAKVDATNFDASKLYICTRTAVNDLINALANPKWDTYKQENRDELQAKYDAMEVAVGAWLDKFFTEAEDRSDVNINRIIPNYVEYKDATYKYLLELFGVEKLVNDYIAEIDALLGTTTTWYEKETVLFTEIPKFVELKERIDADDKQYGFVINALNTSATSADDATVIERYNELVAGLKYAEAANEKAMSFKVGMLPSLGQPINGTSLSYKLSTLAATNNAVTIRNAELYDAAVEQYNKWVVLPSGKELDDANVNKILEVNNIDADALEAVGERTEELKDAREAVKEINAEIAKYYKVENGAKVYTGTYYDMTAIEAIEIMVKGYVDPEYPMPLIGWLQRFGIEVPTSGCATYLVDNYNMLDHAGLAFILQACDDKIDEVLDDAEEFKKLVEALQGLEAMQNMDYPLYYYDLYTQSVAAFTEWVIEHDIRNIQDPNFNFGTHEEEGVHIQELYAYMITVGEKVSTEYAAAKAEFEAAAATFKAFADKYTAEYAATIEDAWVVNAYTVATAWVNNYLDMAEGGKYFGNAASQTSIDACGLLTQETYENILAAKAAYDAKVIEARAALNAIVGTREDDKIGFADFHTIGVNANEDGTLRIEMYFDALAYTFSVIADADDIKAIETAINAWIVTYLGDTNTADANTADIVDMNLKGFALYAITGMPDLKFFGSYGIKGLVDTYNERAAAFEGAWERIAAILANETTGIDAVKVDLYSLVEGEAFEVLYTAYKAFADLYLGGDMSKDAWNGYTVGTKGELIELKPEEIAYPENATDEQKAAIDKQIADNKAFNVEAKETNEATTALNAKIDILAALVADVEVLNTKKAEAETVKAAKEATRDAIVALIQQLGTVNTADDALLTQINTAYTEWYKEIDLTKEAKGENGYVYMIPSFNGALETTDENEVDNLKTLNDANTKMAAIKAALQAAKNEIAELGSIKIPATTNAAEIKAALEQAIADALAALETYHKLNGILTVDEAGKPVYDKTVFATIDALADTLKITDAEYKTVTDAQAVVASAESIAAVYAIYNNFEEKYPDDELVNRFKEARANEINLIVDQVSAKLAAGTFDAEGYVDEVTERFTSELQSVVDNAGATSKPEVDTDDTGKFDDSWKLSDLT